VKLISLRLDNFRQFYGSEATLSFAERAEKNVTVVFGANGAGKTTVLNAFTWGLYGETTPAFANPDRLVNDRALAEAPVGTVVNALVEIQFEHDANTYRVQRTRGEYRDDEAGAIQVAGDDRLEVSVIRSDGRTWTPRNPQESIEQVLPRRLHSFFFFDGERIEHLTRMEGGEEIEKAVKNVLGLELLERSMRHLRGRVESELNGELQRHGSPEVQKLAEDYANEQATIDKQHGRLEELRQNARSLAQEINDIRERLRELSETKELQDEIDTLEETEETTKGSIRSLNAGVRERINRNGYAAFLGKVTGSCEQLLEEAREKGGLPAPIKRQFVDDLLTEGRCICGSELHSGSTAYDLVASWREKAGLADVEERAGELKAQVAGYGDRATRLFAELADIQSKKAALRETLLATQERLSEANGKLGDRSRQNEELHSLYNRQRDRERELASTNRKEGEVTGELRRSENELKEIEYALRKAKEQNEQAKLAQRRLEVLREAAGFFGALYDLRSQQVREAIDERVRDVYSQIAYTGNWPELTEDYRLVVRKAASPDSQSAVVDVAKSTGENQLLSLAFIGGLAAYARDRYEELGDGDSFGFAGGLFPIVMDSPFGVLDENYQAPLAEGLPKLAHQIVLLVSSKQGLGTVLDNLEDRIDQAYVLARHTPKPDAEQSIRVLNNEIPYLVASDQERVDVIEVVS